MRPIATWLALLLSASWGCTKPSPDDCVVGGSSCEPNVTWCNPVTRTCERLPEAPVEAPLQGLCDSRTGWCWDRPWIVGDYAKGMAVLSQDDLFLLGDSGAIMRRQKGRWSLDHQVPNEHFPAAIAGSAADDLWVVGRRVYHRTAAGWTQVQTPAVGDLHSVWSIDKNDAWAVGGGNILRWDGGAWSVAKQAPRVSAIWAAAKDDVWAVGSPGVALHWDGKAWTAPASGLKDATLLALWGQSGSDIWAVGSARYHYDGVSWTEHAGDAVNVWGDGRGKVWFVSGSPQLVVTQLDTRVGTTQSTVLDVNSRQGGSAFVLAGSSSEDLWLAGAPGAVYHWDGANWVRESRGTSADLSSIAQVGGDVFALSTIGAIQLSSRVGGRWAEEPIAEFSLTSFFNNWIGAASSTEVWAAGGLGQGRGLLHRDGGSWSKVPEVSFAGPIRAFGPSDVRVYGRDAVAQWDGRAWSQHKLTNVVSGELNAVWASSPIDVWAVGSKGLIVHLDRDGWAAQVSGTAQNLFGIWGIGDELFAVGFGGTILHKPAGQSAWLLEATQEEPRDHVFRAVWGFTREDVWAGAWGRYAAHYDGAAWHSIEILGTPSISAMTGNDREMWAVGLGGQILHRSRPMRAP